MELTDLGKRIVLSCVVLVILFCIMFFSNTHIPYSLDLQQSDVASIDVSYGFCSAYPVAKDDQSELISILREMVITDAKLNDDIYEGCSSLMVFTLNMTDGSRLAIREERRYPDRLLIIDGVYYEVAQYREQNFALLSRLYDLKDIYYKEIKNNYPREIAEQRDPMVPAYRR